MRTLTVFLILAVVASVCNVQLFQQNGGTTKNLRDIHFTDVNNGTAVGDSGMMVRTRHAALMEPMQWLAMIPQDQVAYSIERLETSHSSSR